MDEPLHTVADGARFSRSHGSDMVREDRERRGGEKGERKRRQEEEREGGERQERARERGGGERERRESTSTLFCLLYGL